MSRQIICYKFRIYDSPLRLVDINLRRTDQSKSPEEIQYWNEEISWELLGEMIPGMRQRLILWNHEANAPGMRPHDGSLAENQEAIGWVGDAEQDPQTGSVYIYLILADNPEGRVARHFLESIPRGGPNGISLHHIRIGSQAATREISYCHEGARPNTIFVGKVVRNSNSLAPQPSSLIYPTDHGDKTLPMANISHLYNQFMGSAARAKSSTNKIKLRQDFLNKFTPTFQACCFHLQGSLFF
jgi:hypothetical protein